MLNHPLATARRSALHSRFPELRGSSRSTRSPTVFATSRDDLSPDPVLRAVAGATAANVAVLDGSGKILGASKGFRDLQLSRGSANGPSALSGNWISSGADAVPGASDSHCRILPTLSEGCERSPADDSSSHFAGRLIAAQEDERRRIARELHDDFNQRLAMLSIELDQLAGDPAGADEWSSRCRKLRNWVDELAVDIHRLSHRLHPSRLDHLGAKAAVSGLCRELSAGQKMKISFADQGCPTTLPRDVTLCIFRVAQEALRNCVKHSRATKVRVTLRQISSNVRLSVADNGFGFEPDRAGTFGGLGFVSMRERLDLVGGTFQVHSKPGCGTRIEGSIPVG